MAYTDFTQMPVWIISMEIGEEIFLLSEVLGRGGVSEKINFYKYSRGSAMETKSHRIYGMRVKYFEEARALAAITKLDQIIHDLNRIIKTLENRP